MGYAIIDSSLWTIGTLSNIIDIVWFTEWAYSDEFRIYTDRGIILINNKSCWAMLTYEQLSIETWLCCWTVDELASKGGGIEEGM